MIARRKMRRLNGGFTLLELMMATSASMVVLAMMYGAAMMMARSARTSDSVVMLNAEARTAMQSIVRSLRQAPATTIESEANGAFAALGNAAVTNVRFERVADVDGNGNALDEDMNVETDGPFRIVADTNDRNGDGLTTTQLVRLDAANAVVEVLANHLSPAIVTADVYSAPQGGVLFQDIGGGRLQVTLILRHRADVQLPMMVVRLDEVVSPRN